MFCCASNNRQQLKAELKVLHKIIQEDECSVMNLSQLINKTTEDEKRV